MAEIEKAKPGRINCEYNYKATNEEGVVTIESTTIVRDLSPESASSALLAIMEGASAPAKQQVLGS